MDRFWLILREDDEQHGGCIPVVLACLLVVAAVVTYWSSFNFNYFSPGAVLFFIVLVVCCAFGSTSAYKDAYATSFSEIAKKGMAFYSAGVVVYALAALIELSMQEAGSFFDILVIVFGTPLVMAGACLPLLVIQSIAIYVMKK